MPVAPNCRSHRVAPPSSPSMRFNKKGSVVAPLLPAMRRAGTQTCNRAMPAKKLYLHFLMPALGHDKSYKGLFILSDRRGHQHQPPEAALQGLSEKLRTLESLMPNQQPAQHPCISCLGCPGWLTGKRPRAVSFELQRYFSWRLLSPSSTQLQPPLSSF